DVEDREGRRQAAAALGDVDDVGGARVVVVEQVAVQPHVGGHGLGEGLVSALAAADALAKAFGGVAGEGADGLRIPEGIVVDGAGDGRLKQGEGRVVGLARLGQNGFGFLARHVRPLPNGSTPRRWRGSRPGASATISLLSRWPAKLGLWRNTARPAASRRSYCFAVRAARAASMVARRFTSTTARTRPRRARMSISPARVFRRKPSSW